MAKTLTLTPTTGASNNPLGIVFGTAAVMEFKIEPERIVNRDITGIELTMVDLAGIYLSRGSINAFIPWSNVLSFQY